ncbi:divergent PAP2 family protein [Candidatus Omnitrophota bacterium]
MDNIFTQIIENKIFMVTLLAWAAAQAIKVLIDIIRERRFDFRWFVGTGGMPSSHASGAACLATSIGLYYGFNSVYFALAASFALVVMFDAQGVRRASGRQARILNQITKDIYWKGRMQEGSLRELIGHTPVEVLAGFALGTLIAFLAR